MRIYMTQDVHKIYFHTHNNKIRNFLNNNDLDRIELPLNIYLYIHTCKIFRGVIHILTPCETKKNLFTESIIKKQIFFYKQCNRNGKMMRIKKNSRVLFCSSLIYKKEVAQLHMCVEEFFYSNSNKQGDSFY